MTRTMVSADLAFSVRSGDEGAEPLEGRLRGEGSQLELWVSDPAALGAGEGRALAAGLARSLAEHGVTVTLAGPRGALLTLGTTRSPWWQRRVTGTRHIRLARRRALLTLLRSRTTREASVLPRPALAPPATLTPVAPTLVRRPRPPVTTTHDPLGGGRPRLVPATEHKPLDSPREHRLRPGGTRIGSAADNDVVLPGIAPHHAVVRRDDADEYVLLVRVPQPGTTVNGERVRERILRSGSRVQIGEWTFSYYRDEHADHGRPFGGRVGGEAGRQLPQPSYADLVRQRPTEEQP